MLRTTTIKYQAKIRKYILESIPEGWGDTDEERLAELKSEFIRVANHPYNLVKLPNEQDRLADYLMGLPINLKFYNSEILRLDKKLREYKEELSESKADKLLANYWNYMAFHIIKLWGEL